MRQTGEGDKPTDKNGENPPETLDKKRPQSSILRKLSPVPVPLCEECGQPLGDNEDCDTCYKQYLERICW
jgi:hypothetical protein